DYQGGHRGSRRNGCPRLLGRRPAVRYHLPVPSRSPACHAIVTDGLWRKSLSAIRSLGRAGVVVEVMGDSLFTTGFWSRYTRRRLRGRVAARDADAFGASLLAELERLGAQAVRPVVFPMEDATINWVSRHRARVAARADFLLPPEPSLEIAQDKA